ncbi:hypothetical protein [Iningainema tapete]
MKQIDTMTLDEQLELIAYLAQKARQSQLTPLLQHKWREIRGLLKEPALGEDAQTWIFRTRREDDEHRE